MKTITDHQSNLAASQDSINAVNMHLRALRRRLQDLERLPGVRAYMAPEQALEYDIISGLFASLRIDVRPVGV